MAEEFKRRAGNAVSIDSKTKSVTVCASPSKPEEILELLISLLGQQHQEPDNCSCSNTTTATSCSLWIQRLCVKFWVRDNTAALGAFLQTVIDKTRIPLVEVHLIVHQGDKLCTMYQHISELKSLSHFLRATEESTSKDDLNIIADPKLCFVRQEKTPTSMVLTQFDEGNLSFRGDRMAITETAAQRQKEVCSLKDALRRASRHLEYVSFHFWNAEIDPPLFDLYTSTGKLKELRVRADAYAECPSLQAFLRSEHCSIERLSIDLFQPNDPSGEILQALEENVSVVSLRLVGSRHVVTTLASLLRNNENIQELEVCGGLHIYSEDVKKSLADSGLHKLCLGDHDFQNWSLLDGVAASVIHSLELRCDFEHINDDDDGGVDPTANFNKLVTAVLENPTSRVRSLSLEFSCCGDCENLPIAAADAVEILANSLKRSTNSLKELDISGFSPYDHRQWQSLIQAIPQMPRLQKLGLPSYCACQELVDAVKANTSLMDINVEGEDDEPQGNGFRAHALFHIRSHQVSKAMSDRTATRESYCFSSMFEFLQPIQDIEIPEVVALSLTFVVLRQYLPHLLVDSHFQEERSKKRRTK